MEAIEDIVESLRKLATLWFPEEVTCEDSFVVLEDVVAIFLDLAYYMLMTDESIPLAHRQAYQRRDLRHMATVLEDHIYAIDGGAGEHFSNVLHSYKQLSMDMMLNYVKAAYLRELTDITGGVTPELWAKHLRLTIPVRSKYHDEGLYC